MVVIYVILYKNARLELNNTPFIVKGNIYGHYGRNKYMLQHIFLSLTKFTQL
jgi:hypothetical protein